MSVVTAMVRTTFLVNAAYAASGREYGLTPQQGQLLCVLMPQPYGMSELGGMLGLAKSSLTGLVDRTAKLGYVRREPDPLDGRAVRVALTGPGEVLAEDFYAATCRKVEELSAGLADGEREALAELLGRIVTGNEAPEVFMELDEPVRTGSPS
ncbi:MarR family transcriptional regulator [Phytomonospora endophytica]|nr:MarR family transcriptional regulator [Phytomonospora endophytica]